MAWWIFQSLVTTAALAAVVAIVCRLGRIGPVARHALWVLVLLKFVMPPLVVWPWAAPDPLGLARNESHEIRWEPVADAGRLVAIGDVNQPPSVKDVAPPPDSSPLVASPAFDDPISAWTLFAFVWIAGSLCLGTVEVARQMRLARCVRLAAPADASITRRVGELASELGITPMPVVALAGSTSPAVWCLGRPRLLWPAGLRSDSQACIDGIIVHELAHIKRRDHVVGWLELVAGLIWWWNPLFWSVRRALREQAELACDAWVISALPDGRRAYAESLLALSSPGAPAPPPMAAVMGVRASSRRVLERRLVMIMNGRASLRLPSAGLLALALLAAATLPAWATGTADDSPQPTQAAQTLAPEKTQAEQTKPKPVLKSESKVKPVIKQNKTATYTLSLKPQDQWHAKWIQKGGEFERYWFHVKPEALTDEGQKLVSDYSSDLEAIQKEMQAKLAARREAVIQSLQALQDQYTKAGKLDEAVAIRDYLKAGGPARSGDFSVFFREKN
jgi:beta-lactamase regulating signal transducer with metallopeptidase domain